MKQPNLHELIDLPHGEASKRLDAMGHFRDADVKEYTVKVGGYYEPERLYETVTVKAVTEEQAFERAEKMVDFEVCTSFKIVED